MTSAQWIFEQAIHLMDEGSPATGVADHSESADYKHRTLPILNILRVECGPSAAPCGEITGFDAPIDLPDGICQGVLPYGLAAHLLLDENPSLASYFQQRYEELLTRARRETLARSEEITDLYGGIEHGRYAHW